MKDDLDFCGESESRRVPNRHSHRWPPGPEETMKGRGFAGQVRQRGAVQVLGIWVCRELGLGGENDVVREMKCKLGGRERKEGMRKMSTWLIFGDTRFGDSPIAVGICGGT